MNIKMVKYSHRKTDVKGESTETALMFFTNRFRQKCCHHQILWFYLYVDREAKETNEHKEKEFEDTQRKNRNQT